MDQRLQQAIDAARAGKNQEAQRLLAQLLKDDPEQVQAWFLLSHLVESEEKQKAYLGKVLALDPNHEQARQRLVYLHGTGAMAAKMETPTMPAVAADSVDLLEQAEGTTVPPWMVAEGAAGATAVSAAVPEIVNAPEPTPDAEIPDWLKQPVSQEFTETAAPVTQPEESTPAAEIEEVTKPIAPQKILPQPQAKTPSQAARWNLLLAILLIITVIVAYFLIRAFLSL